jgi:zinc transport system ATP-binding protein
MTPTISLEKVSFSYQEIPILQDVSFTISPGEFVGIIGPNGGGKTTLLKLMMGFLKPDSGRIKVFGRPPFASQQRIAYVPQSLRFDRQFPISVLELVLGGRLSHLPWYGKFGQADKTAAIQALEKVGMGGFQDVPFGTLSGGQTQRALIARALASEPRLLLLDEPTASVDSQVESDIYSILRELRGTMTILMVTHNLRVAIELVARVICVQRNVMILKPQEVCEHFAFGLYHPPLLELNQNRRGPTS